MRRIYRTLVRARTVSSPAIVLSPTTLLSTTPEFNDATFTFSEARPVGAYIMGDPFVVGPVTVNSTTPAQATITETYTAFPWADPPISKPLWTDPQTFSRKINGIMYNPQSAGTPSSQQEAQGWDSFEPRQIIGDGPSRSNTDQQPYEDALNVALPYAVTTGFLQKGVSYLEPAEPGTRQSLLNHNILTVVSAASKIDSFRPHPSNGTDTTAHFCWADVNLSFLPSLATPGAGTAPTKADILNKLQSPMMTAFMNTLSARAVVPNEWQTSYGATIAMEISNALIYMTLATTVTADREAVAKAVIQLGLDVFGRIKNGGYPGGSSIAVSWGGGMHWMKMPVVFAAKALESAADQTEWALLNAIARHETFDYFAEEQTVLRVSRANIETPVASGQLLNYHENTLNWSSQPALSSAMITTWNASYRWMFVSATQGGWAALHQMGLLDRVKDDFIKYVHLFDDWYTLTGYSGGNAYTNPWLQAYFDAHWPAYSAAAPTLVRRMARDNHVWFEFDKILSKLAVPATSAFAVTVDGVATTVSSVVVHGENLALVIATTLTSITQVVNVSYTQPGSNKAVTIGGALVPTIASAAATNETGLLADGPALREPIFNNDVPATPQYLKGTGFLTNPGRKKFLVGVRFKPTSFATVQTLFAGGNGSSNHFRLWFHATNGFQVTYSAKTGAGAHIGQGLRATVAWSSGDLGLTITAWALVDLTQLNAAAAYKASVSKGSGAPFAPTLTTSPELSVTDGSLEFDPSVVFLNNQMAAFCTSGGANPFLGSIEWIWFNTFGAADAVPSDLIIANFRNDFDPGENGELVISGLVPERFFPMSLAEANGGGILNRGDGGFRSLAAGLVDMENSPFPLFTSAP